MNLPKDSQNASDVELNITPIIDCFTVLITFLLASASFISIGFFETFTPGPGNSAETSKPDIDATIRIHQNGMVELKWNGKKSGSKKIQDWNEQSIPVITEELKNLKSDSMTINQVMIQANNTTQYRELAQVMNAIDQSGIPAVIGIAEE